MSMATIDASIVIIALPAIFRGIRLDPFAPGNVSYLLWLIMGYLLVQAVLVVSLGRLGDMFGRVRIYNLGFAVFAAASVTLSVDPFTGDSGAIWLIGWRIVQAVGGSMLMANSAAILTDAFPAHQRGMALGINQVAGISGMFIGLLLGGLLAQWNWRAVFWVSVPVGLAGTVWSYRSLREIAVTHRARIDWAGNITFALGAGVLLVAITYGIQPYGGHPTGWTNPWVLAGWPSARLCCARSGSSRPKSPSRCSRWAVQDPGLRGRQRCRPARLRRPRRPAVHAGHLAGRDLAAATRLRLPGHSALGGHLHAAADRRASSSPGPCPASCRTSTGSGCSPPPGCWSSPQRSPA